MLTEAIQLLPQLYRTVLVPQIVCSERRHPKTPARGRAWLETNPAWLAPAHATRTSMMASEPRLLRHGRSALHGC